MSPPTTMEKTFVALHPISTSCFYLRVIVGLIGPAAGVLALQTWTSTSKGQGHYVIQTLRPISVKIGTPQNKIWFLKDIARRPYESYEADEASGSGVREFSS